VVTDAVVMFSAVVIFCLLNRRLLQTFIMNAPFLLHCVCLHQNILGKVRKLARSPNQPCGVAAEENLTRMKLFLQEIKQAKSCFMVVICFFLFSVCFQERLIFLSLTASINMTG
jgi:hypothetical protein